MDAHAPLRPSESFTPTSAGVEGRQRAVNLDEEVNAVALDAP